MTKKIPLFDLKLQYKKMKKEIDSAVRSVILDADFVGTRKNKYVEKFENEFAKYIGVKYCVGCGNGTDAIEIALRALGVGKGDEVLVPALTWISTAESVSNAGAVPVFVDIDPKFFTIDPKEIEKKITKKTKAIIPVHLYGLPAEMDEILKIAKKRKLFVVEDCAQAHGSIYKGKKVGSFGDAAIFSFFPSKNLGAYGDAGCVVTNNDEVEKRCRLIGNHGQPKKNEYLMEGRNSRLDGIQATILSAKLPFLDDQIKIKRNIAKRYDHFFKGKKIIAPLAPGYSKHSYHLYVIRIENRDSAQKKLFECGVETNIHYTVALPFIPPYRKFKPKAGDFPNARAATAQILSIPMHAELSKNDADFVAKKIIEITEHE